MNLEWAAISCQVVSRIFIILQSHTRSCGSNSQDIERCTVNSRASLWLKFSLVTIFLCTQSQTTSNEIWIQ